jgi:hypothetical protein
MAILFNPQSKALYNSRKQGLYDHIKEKIGEEEEYL